MKTMKKSESLKRFSTVVCVWSVIDDSVCHFSFFLFATANNIHTVSIRRIEWVYDLCTLSTPTIVDCKTILAGSILSYDTHKRHNTTFLKHFFFDTKLLERNLSLLPVSGSMNFKPQFVERLVMIIRLHHLEAFKHHHPSNSSSTKNDEAHHTQWLYYSSKGCLLWPHQTHTQCMYVYFCVLKLYFFFVIWILLLKEQVLVCSFVLHTVCTTHTRT